MTARPITRPTYLIESVDHALVLLNAVRDHGSLRLKEAAAEIGVAESTAHRLLAMLIYRGFVVQDESRRYCPGPAIGVGPARSAWARALRHASMATLRELAEATGETVNLVVRTGPDSRVIATVESEKLLRVGNRQGHVPKARESAGGKILLAELEEDILARLYLGDGAPPADRMTPEEFAALCRELRISAERGYATALDSVEVGLSSIAVSLRNHAGTAVGALVVAMPTQRFRNCSLPALFDLMRRAAAQVEQRIGDMRTADD